MFKKVYELSVLCDTEVGLVVFFPAGSLYEFASSTSSFFRRRNQFLDDSLSTKLNHITQCVLESKIDELSLAELRGFEEAMTNALTVVKNKLMMKVADLLAESEKNREELLNLRAIYIRKT